MPILKVHPLRFVHQQMNPWWYLLLTLLQLHLSLILSFLPSSSSSSGNYSEQYEKCTRTQYSCGYENYTISYPFNFLSGDRPNFCGRRGYSLTCDEEKSALMLQTSGKQYQVRNIDYFNHSLTISDPAIVEEATCPSLSSIIDNNMDPSLFEFNPNIVGEISFMNCVVPYPERSSFDCTFYSAMRKCLYYLFEDDSAPYPDCEITHVWMDQTTLRNLQSSSINMCKALEEGFTVTWKAGRGPPCDRCSQRGGVCTYDDTSGREACVCSSGLCRDEENNELLPTPKEKSHRKRDIAIGVSISGGFMIAMLIGLLLLYRRRKRKLRSSILLSRNGSIDPSFSKEEAELGTYPELGVSRYHTHVFTFDELHEATDGFSASNQLGDGGFGTVYKGLLRDGRVVAVKRLFQQNYRRLEQFMNEVDILSDLRHPNLVMLYGCTSRHSRDLLLVYEYVANGTVADHLYGVQADAGFLAWPTRMSIAIQTADALAYLHDDGTQIIHRDVKTNNILLDEDFHVKVADFGLSRLFPTNATHVSTAPQGTPGYLDPEYHQCYQLTDKSDVYSFGVVLAELISSKPAVDVTRQRSEINLSNMAVNKIQKQELDQFVDPRLGYQSDYGTREMIDWVAELAFRCLQLESDMRPTMKEALEVLRGIRSRGREAETTGMKVDVEVKEDAHLLKNVPLCSPNSVTERWASVATTPNASS